MFKKIKAPAFSKQKIIINMKYTFIITVIVILLAGCTNTNTSKSNANNTSKAESKDKSKAGILATKTCDCLKPFAVLQNQYGKKEISSEEYANKLKALAKPMQNCTNNLTEATEDRADLKDEVLFKMKQICPKVAEIIVSAQ